MNVKFIAIFLLAATLWSCHSNQTKEVEAKGFQTITIALSQVEITSSYSASIRGKQDVDIRPQISGVIEKVCVMEGEIVK